MTVIALLGGLAVAAVDVNSADVRALADVPGIGPEKAAAIVAWRDRHGPFETLAELDVVPGIGSATVRATRRFLAVRAAGPAPAPAPVAQPKATIAAAFDPNTASADDLAAVPGIGATKAAAIVADRDRHGPFATCGDLVRVEGIGPATLAAIADRCRVDQGSSPGAPPM